VTDAFSYDAWGLMLGGNPTLAGPADEYFDTAMQQYYLRARWRWHEKQTGRFSHMDPFTDTGLLKASRAVIIVAAESFQNLMRT
jgi:hypothetical protein